MSKRMLRFLLTFVVVVILHIFYVTFYAEKTAKIPLILQSETQRGNFIMYCDRKRTNMSQPCLCYADFYAPGQPRNATSGALFDPASLKCAITFRTAGRMGNQMGMYATLLVLARLNQRPALIIPRMALLLNAFQVSLPVLDLEMVNAIKWNVTRIESLMRPTYRNFSGMFLAIKGFPRSNSYFGGAFEEEVRREFRLKVEVRDRAQKVLKEIASTRTTPSVTFVGVHVRRGDYDFFLKKFYNGVLADRNYFSEATAHFRAKYADAVFVVVSNDMQWCVDNIDNSENDVVFAGNNDESDGMSDFALLVSCNHSIITVGSYGFFAAFLAAGDVVYLANFTKSRSDRLTYVADYPKHWHPIAATDFSSLPDNNEEANASDGAAKGAENRAPPSLKATKRTPKRHKTAKKY